MHPSIPEHHDYYLKQEQLANERLTLLNAAEQIIQAARELHESHVGYSLEECRDTVACHLFRKTVREYYKLKAKFPNAGRVGNEKPTPPVPPPNRIFKETGDVPTEYRCTECGCRFPAGSKCNCEGAEVWPRPQE